MNSVPIIQPKIHYVCPRCHIDAWVVAKRTPICGRGHMVVEMEPYRA